MTSTLSDEIFRELAKAIVSGEFQPGQRLDEPSVCKRFGVSRTPVREALRQLSGAGLVEVVARKGVTVSKIDVAQLTDMFDALGEFEGLCARLSAERMTPVERRRLQVLNETLLQNAEEGLTPLSHLNEQFHELIYKGARNESIANVARSFRQRLAPFQLFQFSPNETVDAFHDHGLITNAIVDVNPAEAQRKMRDHITRSSLQVIDHFAKMEHQQEFIAITPMKRLIQNKKS